MKRHREQHGSQRRSLLSEYCDRLGNTVLRHRTTLALNAARVDAELASKAKSEFIAKMSHELRTPLNAIIGFSEILCDGHTTVKNPDKIPEYAKYIESSAHHLLSIVNNILELSKIHSGRAALHTEKIDLEEVLDSSLVLFQETVKDNGIEIRREIRPDLPLIEADLTKVRQILINLVSNAVKFTPAGGRVTITIDIQNETHVQLVVRDTGIGMTPEDLNVALQPFGQADGGTNRRFEGTGLGLPIVRALVELHDGSLHVHSEVDKGTTVTLLLPLDADATAKRGFGYPSMAITDNDAPPALNPQGV